MADPKDEYVETIMNGVKIKIPRGDMIDEDWNKVLVARDDAVARFGANAKEGDESAHEPTLAKKMTLPAMTIHAPDMVLPAVDVNSKEVPGLSDQPYGHLTSPEELEKAIGKKPAPEKKPKDEGGGKARGAKAFFAQMVKGATPRSQVVGSDPANAGSWADVTEPAPPDKKVRVEMSDPMAATPAAVENGSGSAVNLTTGQGGAAAPTGAVTGGTATGAGGAGGNDGAAAAPAPGKPLNSGVDAMENGLLQGAMQTLNPLSTLAQIPQGLKAAGQIAAGPDAQPRKFADHPGIAAGTHHAPQQDGDIPLEKHPMLLGDVPNGSPQLPADTAPATDAAYEAQKKAITDKADLNTHAVWEQQRVQEEAVRASDASAVYNQKKQEYVDKSVKEQIQQSIDISNRLRDASQTVNPDRYWDNHSKFLFVLGSALMGLGKDGPGAAFAKVHAGIQADIAAQQADISNARENLVAAGNMKLNIVGQLRAHGQDGFEATKNAEAIMLGQTTRRIQAIASKYDQSTQQGVIVNQNADAMLAQIEVEKQKALSAAAQHRSTMSIEKFNSETARENARTAREGLGLKADKTKMTEAEQKAHLAAVAGINTIQEIRQQLGPVRGVFGAVKDEAMSKIPGSDMNGRKKAISALNFKLATALSQSSLQAHESEYWIGKDGKGGVLGNVGLDNMTQAQLDALEQTFQRAAESAQTRRPAGALTGGALPSEAPYGG